MQLKSISRFKIFLLLAGCGFVSVVFSQNGWTARPFGQKVFIENKTQFDGKAGKTAILYGAGFNSVETYFTATGVTWKHDSVAPMKEWEIEAAEKEQIGSREENERREEEEKDKFIKAVPVFLSVEWIGCNAHAEVVASEPVSFYYTYPGAIKANAYKRIVYKNIYPLIDVVYTFPSDSSGIKYAFVLHPGADPSVIKMKYSYARGMTPDAAGNLQVKSAFGTFTDHAPVTYYSGTREPVRSSFLLKGSTVTFSIEPYDHAREVVIDPWTTVPTFGGYNAAYDVKYDLAGNVYVCGSAAPFQIIKLSNAGAIQWIYSAATLNANFHGGFCVDEVSGASYLMEGWSFGGAKAVKVNTLGAQTAALAPNFNYDELWRAEYDRCLGKIVIGSGGASANMQAFLLDTNLTSLTPSNVLAATNPFHDMALFALDNTGGSCYMATAASTFAPTAFNNVIVKCPLPSFTPIVFMVADGHLFTEQGSPTYVNGTGFGVANGFNGMAVSPGWLYTYDSDSLKRWDKNTGAYIAGIDVSPTPPTYSGTTILVSWAGLSVDDCDHIYAGMSTSLLEYDSALTLVNTSPLPDTVYDVQLGINGKLYACGLGFVTEINVPATSVTFAATQVAAACNLCDGIATANVTSSSCAINPSGFAYAWSTSPVQTTQTATNLCPGTYTVTVTNNCNVIFTGTVLITTGIGPTVDLGNDTTVCGAPNLLLDAGAPGTYTWSTGDSTQTITVNSVGTYWVTVSDSGCSATDTIVILGLAAPDLGNDTSLCSGQLLTLTAPAAGSYLWSTGATTQTISVSIAGQYWVNVTAGACTLSDTINVAFTPLPAPSLPDTTLCPNDSLVLDAGIATAYVWSTGATTQTILVSTAGTYTVLVSNGSCTVSDSAVIASLPPIALEQDITLCGAQNHVLDAGVPNVAYSWSTGATSQTITVTESGVYWVTVTSNGCTLSDTTTVRGELSGGALYVPNTFTPNENGLNENFTGYGVGITYFHLQIFNRWGELIFETSDMNAGWDGTYKGRVVQEDIYVWKIEYKAGCTKDAVIDRIGHVGVIR